jgi:hypothetical protein
MERERRYFVIKLTDAAKYLTPSQIIGLREMGEQIDELRAADWKPPMHGVFVEHDWPEYEPTWQAIEARMDAVPNACGEPGLTEPGND